MVIEMTYDNPEGIHPVIGMILMVAITVILAAVIAVYVFGMAKNIEQTPATGEKNITIILESKGFSDSVGFWIDGRDKLMILRRYYSGHPFTEKTEGINMEDLKIGEPYQITIKEGGYNCCPDSFFLGGGGDCPGPLVLSITHLSWDRVNAT